MYYIYRTVNLQNGHDYIGKRKCPLNKTPLEDNYLGSGKALQLAIQKYGKENFKKDILATDIETVEDLNLLEREYISRFKEQGEAYYNIASGGDGGNTFKYLSDSDMQRLRDLQRSLTSTRYENMTEEQKKARIDKMLATKASWSPEKREAYIKSQSEKRKLAASMKSEKDELVRKQKFLETWYTAPLDVQQQRKDNNRSARLRYEASLTEDQRRERRHNLSNKLGKEYSLISPKGELLHIKGLQNFCRETFGDAEARLAVSRLKSCKAAEYKGYKLLK